MKGGVIIIKWILFYFTIIEDTFAKTTENSHNTLFKNLAENLFKSFSAMKHDFLDVSGKDIEHEEYDFVIVGGGTAGSVVANRLSEVGNWKVLLLEAGNYQTVAADIPIIVPALAMTDLNWGYTTEPQANACWAMEERRCKLPAGKCLGGSTVIDYMIYARGNKLDYDLWAQLGNDGWSFDEVLPYFLKSENMRIPDLNLSKYHSSDGYLSIEHVPFRTPLAQAFLDGAEGLGYKISDYNGEDQLSFSFIQATMHDGSRCSASNAFLEPTKRRNNLHISVNSTVTKLIIDPQTKQATGVEFVKHNVTYKSKARKEVILSAGSVNSAQILMLSGIGPGDHLEELGIPLVSNLKVGYHLQDHVAFYGLSFIINDTVALNTGRLKSSGTIFQYLREQTGPLAVPGGVEATGYIRTKYAQDARPDVQLILVSAGFNEDANKTSWKSIGFQLEMYEKLVKPIGDVDTWTIVPVLLQPKSYGRVKLQDKNPFHWPIEDPKYLTDKQDIAVLVEGIKVAISIADTLPFKQHDSKIHSIPVPGCEELIFGSDEYWTCAIKYFSSSSYHQSGTCKMGPATDPDAVVDPTLRVFGVEGLRVVDMSILPSMTTAQTGAVAYMIGEKASDLIKGTWNVTTQEPQLNVTHSKVNVTALESGSPNLLPRPILETQSKENVTALKSGSSNLLFGPILIILIISMAESL